MWRRCFWMLSGATAVACGSFSAAPTASDAGDVDAGAADADVYPGTVVAEEHFDAPGVQCPDMTGNYVTLERASVGRSGKSCLVCNDPAHRDFLANSTTLAKAQVAGTYTVHAWVHAAPDAGVPEIVPAFLVNGSVPNQGNTWKPDGTWHLIEHSSKVAAANVSWALLGNSATGVSCVLLDDVTVTRE